MSYDNPICALDGLFAYGSGELTPLPWGNVLAEETEENLGVYSRNVRQFGHDAVKVAGCQRGPHTTCSVIHSTRDGSSRAQYCDPWQLRVLFRLGWSRKRGFRSFPDSLYLGLGCYFYADVVAVFQLHHDVSFVTVLRPRDQYSFVDFFSLSHPYHVTHVCPSFSCPGQGFTLVA